MQVTWIGGMSPILAGTVLQVPLASKIYVGVNIPKSATDITPRGHVTIVPLPELIQQNHPEILIEHLSMNISGARERNGKGLFCDEHT